MTIFVWHISTDFNKCNNMHFSLVTKNLLFSLLLRCPVSLQDLDDQCSPQNPAMFFFFFLFLALHVRLIHLYKFLRCVTRCLHLPPLDFSMPCVCLILHALFPHYASLNFIRCFLIVNTLKTSSFLTLSSMFPS